MECEKARLSVLITDDREIQEINRKWLGKDRPTDVISFSQIEGAPVPTDFMGDVVISVETAARNAREIGHSLEEEIDRLLVHGVLHLLGYDHVRGGRQAGKMKKEEQRIMARLREDEHGR